MVKSSVWILTRHRGRGAGDSQNEKYTRAKDARKGSAPDLGVGPGTAHLLHGQRGPGRLVCAARAEKYSVSIFGFLGRHFTLLMIYNNYSIISLNLTLTEPPQNTAIVLAQIAIVLVEIL